MSLLDQLTIEPVIAAVRVIDAHPDRWNQANWGLRDVYIPELDACGTAFCVAGHMVHQSPDWVEEWHPYESGLSRVRRTGAFNTALPDEAARQIIGLPDVYNLPYEDARDYWNVRDLLDNLFDAKNNRADIQECAIALADYLGVAWPVSMPEWAKDEMRPRR